MFGFSVIASIFFLFSLFACLGLFIFAKLLLVVSDTFFLSFLVRGVLGSLFFRGNMLNIAKVSLTTIEH